MKENLKTGNNYKDYESINILERWLISSTNLGQLDCDTVFPSNIRTLSTTKKMKEEFEEKKILDSEKKIDFLCNQVENFLRKEFESQEYKIEISLGEKSVSLKYNNFCISFSEERISLLLKKTEIKHLMTTILRYQCISPGAQHWNIPFEIYKLLDDEFELEIEGFASPFNSQLLKLKGGNFCSLFKDTDSVYGSLGSFFDQSFIGKRAILNTPYLPEILEKIVEKCISTCSKTKDEETILIINVPTWRDAKFFQHLQNSQFKKKEFDHPKFEHYFENSNLNDIPVLATFGASWFVLAKNCKRNYNFDLFNNLFEGSKILKELKERKKFF